MIRCAVRNIGDGSTIGILLAADRDDIAVQYALRGLSLYRRVETKVEKNA